MPTEIFQIAATGFKHAIDLIKSINHLDKSVNINAVKIELQQIVLDAHTAQTAMVDRIRELEAEVTKFETWDAEKERYQLTEIASGVFAYALKEEAEPAEPFHYICQACYQHQRKSILQKKIGGGIAPMESYECHECDAEIKDHGVRAGRAPVVVSKKPR
ncbi:hypothetical protein [Singulisphaera sp. PoT]|uniref:hypothetical protein n=1 Tax=Singulisphaera sp. PoT TaxID=3411797 RepID=UPI003BF5657C